MAQAQYMQQGYAAAYPYPAYATPQQQGTATGKFAFFYLTKSCSNVVDHSL
jgi:hypothetical protein